MVEHRAQFERLLPVFTVIALALLLAYAYFAALTFTQMFSRIGLATLLSGMAWGIFRRWAWKWPVLIRLHSVPDLNGRWVGTLDREDENNPHEFVLEIRQLFDRISCCTYTKNGRSESVVATLLSDGGSEPFRLLYTWFGQTTGTVNGAPGVRTGWFHGTTILDVVKPNPRSLKGHYFTDRYPRQTRGIIRLEFESSDCRNSF